MAKGLRGMAEGEDPEAPSEQRMGRVRPLDLFGIGERWVLEGGIMLWGGLTTSATISS